MFSLSVLFFFTDTATTEIYTLSLHDALPISLRSRRWIRIQPGAAPVWRCTSSCSGADSRGPPAAGRDRKSTRLNSSHQIISYAVFCLKKKKKKITEQNYKTIQYPNLVITSRH